MRFCEICGNMMVPRKGKLFCKACDQEFDLNLKQEEDYKLIKTIKHDEKEVTPIVVKEGHKGEKISDQDRKAFEEFFTSGEQGVDSS
ncbi:MAG TPA: hypothetical protein VGB37_07625 [Candidatus Lokiarchaeia archaeon]|jgi:DNA-directed RNA polymerase subunit M/transcription elongation factor TFIIS